MCHPAQVQRYMARVSGPLLDRIDLHIEVPTLDARNLTHADDFAEPSEAIRARVVAARDRQLSRYRHWDGVRANAHLNARGIREFCQIDEKSAILLRQAIERLGLSARAYHRVLKLARTIADMEGVDWIAVAHIAEGIQYRSLDRMPVPVQ